MNVPPVRHLVYAWLALLALLALTLASAYVPMGQGNVAINFAVAFAKTVVVMVLFMHAAASGGFVRLLAVAGFAWLLVLAGLGWVDYGTRDPANASRPALVKHR